MATLFCAPSAFTVTNSNSLIVAPASNMNMDAPGMVWRSGSLTTVYVTMQVPTGWDTFSLIGSNLRATDTIRGTIDGKARFKIYNPPDKTGLRTDAGNVEYSISLGCKDGKFRYQITDINLKQASYYPIERWADTTALTYSKVFLYYLEQTDSLIHEVTKNLEAFMKKSPAENKDDW